MKNLLNLGKALSKAEQKEILGGTFRDECDPGSGSSSGVYLSESCQCWASGGDWDAECGECGPKLPGFYKAC